MDKKTITGIFGKEAGTLLYQWLNPCCTQFCDDIKACLGISETGDPNLVINQQGTWITNGGGGGAGWSLTGNAGTTGANFLGTTDDQPLLFRINNTPAGAIERSSGTIAFGHNANPVGTTNTVFGNEAFGTAAVSIRCTIIGFGADVATPATERGIAIGYQAIAANNDIAFSIDGQRFRVPGFTTSPGRVLTDVNGDGTVTLEQGIQTGTALLNGTGAALTFSIPVVGTPTWASVTPASPDAGLTPFSISVGLNAIGVTFQGAPPLGVNNVVFFYSYKL